MDGLDSRGQVILVGATNRIDSLDAALRRPGRFDRELQFALPNATARREILRIHTAPWTPAPSADLIAELAEKTHGYCGADLKALCAEAALRSLHATYPQAPLLLWCIRGTPLSGCVCVALRCCAAERPRCYCAGIRY